VALIEPVWPAIGKNLSVRAKMKPLKGEGRVKVAIARRFLSIIYRVLKEKRTIYPVALHFIGGGNNEIISGVSD